MSPPPLSPPPSARTNHTPACQFACQQFLSAVHKVLYLAPFSHRGHFLQFEHGIYQSYNLLFFKEYRTFSILKSFFCEANVIMQPISPFIYPNIRRFAIRSLKLCSHIHRFKCMGPNNASDPLFKFFAREENAVIDINT